MEELERSLFLVNLFNKILGKPMASFLGLVGIQVKNPEHLVPDYIVMSLIVMTFLMLFFGLASRKLTLVPSKRQSALELIIQTIEGLITDIIGPEGKRYLPLVATVGLFVFSCNMLGLEG